MKYRILTSLLLVLLFIGSVHVYGMGEGENKDGSLLDMLINGLNQIGSADEPRPGIQVVHPHYEIPAPRRDEIYTGPCPIGELGAPQLRDPGYESGSLCRGTCGPDCPSDRCKKLDPVKINYNGGVCEYDNVIRCPTHPSCQKHDDCFDWCAAHGAPKMLGSCHMTCNYACLAEYGLLDCGAWKGNKFIENTLGHKPKYTGSIVYSDAPVFTPGRHVA
jgi:hypothetical protein